MPSNKLTSTQLESGDFELDIVKIMLMTLKNNKIIKKGAEMIRIGIFLYYTVLYTLLYREGDFSLLKRIKILR